MPSATTNIASYIGGVDTVYVYVVFTVNRLVVHYRNVYRVLEDNE